MRGVLGIPSAAQMHGDAIGLRADGTPGLPLRPYVGVREETAAQKRIAHTHTCFNRLRSDSLPLEREVPDLRSAACRAVAYPADLPAASVIMVFVDEPLSPLLRSVHSVLRRTPPELLREIVLVDDGSTGVWHTAAEYREQIALLGEKVRLLQLGARRGLMVARVEGARAARGEVGVVLDSHIEVNHGWLEPLLAHVAADRTAIAIPQIGTIHADSFEYSAHGGGLGVLGFHWGLGQTQVHGRSMSPLNSTAAVASPIMAGGLLAFDIARFFDLGGYDEQMRIYGGEEMEISFRYWQCGGSLAVLPCSHVGHVFRTNEHWQGQVYTVPGEEIARNKRRAAAVWMDEFAEVAFGQLSPLPPSMSLGSLEVMREVRTRHQCKPFRWYLEHVFPEHGLPEEWVQKEHYGEVRNAALNACFDHLNNGVGELAGLYPCHHAHGTQQVLLAAGKIVSSFSPTANALTCVAPAAAGQPAALRGAGRLAGGAGASPGDRFAVNASAVRLASCGTHGGRADRLDGGWRFEATSSDPGRIVEAASGLCLAALEKEWLALGGGPGAGGGGRAAEVGAAALAKSPFALGLVACDAVPPRLTQWQLNAFD